MELTIFPMLFLLCFVPPIIQSKVIRKVYVFLLEIGCTVGILENSTGQVGGTTGMWSQITTTMAGATVLLIMIPVGTLQRNLTSFLWYGATRRATTMMT